LIEPDHLGVESALRGEKLYGDDFSPEQIRAWVADEELGYFGLGAWDKTRYQYKYHALNQRHAWRYLPERRFPRVLGIGSAYGEELKPIAGRVGHFTIVEPADGFVVDNISGVPATYVKPRPDGVLPFDDGSFDLITCFSALHHLPNVSAIVAELRRCLKADGYLLLREPTVSMGDWQHPRAGLTKRERGIPLRLFRQLLGSLGLVVVHESRCVFSLTSQLAARFPVFASPVAVWIDDLLCRLPFWSTKYHATTIIEKLRPTAVSFVTRPSTAGRSG
jgi:SAM-dependent methyltransferase